MLGLYQSVYLSTSFSDSFPLKKFKGTASIKMRVSLGALNAGVAENSG